MLPAALLALLSGACSPANPLKVGCRQSADCTDGRACVDGLCENAGGSGGETSAAGGGGGAAGLDAEGGAGGAGVGGQGGAYAGVVRTPAPANCNNSNWDPLHLTTVDDVRTLMLGKWVKCGGGGPESLPSPFELADDGSWYELLRQPDGSLARAKAFGQHGAYEIVNPSQLLANLTQSNIAFSLNPYLMNLGPALYTVAK